MSSEHLKKSISGYAEFRYEDKKSVFIAEAFQITNESEARNIIDDCKKKYHDANHHCYAYIVDNGMIARYSDDSEPQGTAGLPILNVLKNYEIEDVIVVVTRYFGGTLLGTGGLTRAYGGAAKGAVDKSGLVEYRKFLIIEIVTDYSDYQKVSQLASKNNITEELANFTDVVTSRYIVSFDSADAFKKSIVDLTSGKASVNIIDECEHPIRI